METEALLAQLEQALRQVQSHLCDIQAGLAKLQSEGQQLEVAIALLLAKLTP